MECPINRDLSALSNCGLMNGFHNITRGKFVGVRYVSGVQWAFQAAHDLDGFREL